MLRRYIHYVWRHWEQLKRIPGISWQRIVRCRTMMDMDEELSCKVHMLIPKHSSSLVAWLSCFMRCCPCTRMCPARFS